MVGEIEYLERWGRSYAEEAFSKVPACKPGEAYWYIDGEWVGPIRCPSSPPVQAKYPFIGLPAPPWPRTFAASIAPTRD